MPRSVIIKKIINLIVTNSDFESETFKSTRCMTLSQLEGLDMFELREILEMLNKEFKTSTSIYDVKKLTYAIQSSSISTVGKGSLYAFTNYVCNICKASHKHQSSLTPTICRDCAKKIAENIISNEIDLLRDNVKAEWREN